MLVEEMKYAQIRAYAEDEGSYVTEPGDDLDDDLDDDDKDDDGDTEDVTEETEDVT